MAVSMTVRNVPNSVRDELAARAARTGQSMQEYLRSLLISAASKPSMDEVIGRARARVAATDSRVAARSILDSLERDSR